MILVFKAASKETNINKLIREIHCTLTRLKKDPLPLILHRLLQISLTDL